VIVLGSGMTSAKLTPVPELSDSPRAEPSNQLPALNWHQKLMVFALGRFGFYFLDLFQIDFSHMRKRGVY
jgi:hypothetical protein